MSSCSMRDVVRLRLLRRTLPSVVLLPYLRVARASLRCPSEEDRQVDSLARSVTQPTATFGLINAQERRGSPFHEILH